MQQEDEENGLVPETLYSIPKSYCFNNNNVRERLQKQKQINMEKIGLY